MNDNLATRVFKMLPPNAEILLCLLAHSNNLSQVINSKPDFCDDGTQVCHFCCDDQVIGTYTFGQDGAGKEMLIYSIEWMAESNEVAVTYVLWKV